MFAFGRARERTAVNIWPGFVDGLASLLMVVIFVLMLFFVAQTLLSSALSGRDEALERLNQQVSELADLLALEQGSNENLRGQISSLSSELTASLTQREYLSEQLAILSGERESLQRERDALSLSLDTAETAIADRDVRIEYLLAAIAERTLALEGTEADLNAVTAELAQNEDALAALRAELEAAYGTIEVDRETLEVRLAELAALEALRRELEASLATASNERDQEIEVSARAQTQISLLNQQLTALREQLAELEALLATIEADNEAKNVEIASLGQRLNAALATQVQQLARYRSEFFGRLREILGGRDDIQIVGDRFVFQSEVLFASGSATLATNGRTQLTSLAQALLEIAADIPEDIDWILRVDGHTDRQPISTPEFPSNWELSTARALSVVHFLIAQGIPERRLVAAGFGEFRPLLGGESQDELDRNRRIELKLDQR